MAHRESLRIVTTGCLVIMLFGACDRPQELRTEFDRDLQDTLFVAAAWSWDAAGAESYWRGLQLAATDANEDGGVMGQPLEPVRIDDKATVTEGRLAAHKIVNDGRYFAVIGHLHSHVSVPTAPVYERAGLLMMNPASTAPELTRSGMRLVFRTVNSDVESARQLATHFEESGYGRVVICYVRNAYGLGLANAFEAWAYRLGTEVVDRKSYEPSQSRSASSYSQVVRGWQDLRFDAVLLAGAAPQAAHVIRAIREAGLQQPILGGDALHDEDMLALAGSAAEGLVVLSTFHPHNPNPRVESFRARYGKVYRSAPDAWTARGYESLAILVDAVRQAGSIDAKAIASVLRARDDWRGLHGPIGFDDEGNPLRRPGVAVQVVGGRFDFLREIRNFDHGPEGPPDPPKTSRAGAL